MENQKLLVTLVTPSFNQGEFLEATINSVLAQTYKNIEYFIFDGGSTDNSIEILTKYSTRITYWESKKDKGQANAINKGWKMGSGKIFCWLNSDDLLLPNAVADAVKAFVESENIGVVHGDWKFIDTNGTVLESKKGKKTSFKRMLINGQIKYIGQPASFYSANIVREVGLLDEELHFAMDYDLLLKLAKNYEMKYIPVEMALFRLHGCSKTSSQARKHWKETLAVQRKYGYLSMYKSIIKYLLFLSLNSLPEPLEMLFRRWRNSFHGYARLLR